MIVWIIYHILLISIALISISKFELTNIVAGCTVLIFEIIIIYLQIKYPDKENKYNFYDEFKKAFNISNKIKSNANEGTDTMEKKDKNNENEGTDTN
jgi:glucan phosphoethanolaminetransferase (alkaline phosphatase superfamily)